MTETSLNTTSGDGNQAATQTPQAAGQANVGGTSSSNVQPGTASSLLTNGNGVQLKDTPLTTVNLNTSSSGSVQQPSSPGHHINPVLGGFSLALFALAIFLFWWTGRSVKNTTE